MVAGHPLDFYFPFSTLTLSLPPNSAFCLVLNARSLSRKLAISRALRFPRPSDQPTFRVVRSLQWSEDGCFIVGAVQHPEAQYVTVPEI